MINILWILFLFCSCNLFGQVISGTVTDSQSGLPIPHVHVRVVNSNLGTIADAEGRFEFANLPPGVKLVLSAVGYQTSEQVIADTTSMVTMETLSIYLNNDITITAKRFGTNQFDISESVTIVDSKELQQMAPRSAPEALMGMAGVWVQKTNHGGGSPIIRGLVGNQILLMVDGIRMNNATYRYGPNQYLATIDPGLIERIETIRGNGSVLYGGDALGGVVQILSRTPYFQSDGNHLHGHVNGRWMSDGMERSGRAEFQWNGEKLRLSRGFQSGNTETWWQEGPWVNSIRRVMTSFPVMAKYYSKQVLVSCHT